MLKSLGKTLANWSEKYMPDPFLFAIILTFVTYLLGIFVAHNGPFQMIQHWYKGFWELLTFAMQMVLILVTGHALASTPAMKKILRRIADLPKSPLQTVYLTGFVACVLGWIHWGFGLIGGGVLALYMARSAQARRMKLHYPICVAAAYLSLLIWHNGLSGSAPLLCATKGHFLEEQIGLIPVSATIFSRFNIVISVGLLAICPVIMMLMTPTRESDIVPADPELLDEALPEEEKEVMPGKLTFNRCLENSRIVTILSCLLGFAYLVWYFATKGFALNLNIVNFLFLIVGMALWQRPIRYVRAIAEATKGVSGVILQFPFYAGIMGMMKFSGLVGIIAGWFVAISTKFTYPIWGLISAGIMNLFVPSGGGQVAVQGPVLVKAAADLGVSIPKTLVALACGDELTNMVQPFWAIALLGIARLKPKDIMGYCIAVMMFAFFIMALGLTFIR